MANIDPRGKTNWLKGINWTQPAGELRVLRQQPHNPGAGLDHPAVTRRPGGAAPLNPQKAQK
jgi:hypothetical protein